MTSDTKIHIHNAGAVELGPPLTGSPVIVSERLDAPYTKHGWSRAFRRIRDDLGIPDTVKMMDTRAGALTEAKNLGVDPFALRDLGTHAHVSTTDGYARGRSENINKVVELRGRK